MSTLALKTFQPLERVEQLRAEGLLVGDWSRVSWCSWATTAPGATTCSGTPTGNPTRFPTAHERAADEWAGPMCGVQATPPYLSSEWVTAVEPLPTTGWDELDLTTPVQGATPTLRKL